MMITIPHHSTLGHHFLFIRAFNTVILSDFIVSGKYFQVRNVVMMSFSVYVIKRARWGRQAYNE